MQLPRFARVAPIGIETDGDITRVTIAPLAYGTLPTTFVIRLHARQFHVLLEEGWTEFGSRGGHITIAKPGQPEHARRLHPLLTGAVATYRCLYRDGDRSNLVPGNLGFRTPGGGYSWWLVPQAGELDPGWNIEGKNMHLPKAITSARQVNRGPQPAPTPVPRKPPPPSIWRPRKQSMIGAGPSA